MRPCCVMLVFAATVALATPGKAETTLDALRNSGALRAAVIVDSKGPFYERAPLILAVEVATPRWFSRGTRVSDIRVPNAVIRPMSNFADNTSRRINGETWSVQRWRFRVFPRSTGALSLPPVQVFVSVNGEGNEVVEGTLQLSSPSIDIQAPPGLAALDDEQASMWIATSSLAIEQEWQGLLDSYLPGDAITRTRRFVARDTPAMMLEASRADKIDGLSQYVAPADVLDRSDRGTLTGRRTETVVITFAEPGEYQIPGLAYPWFNTKNQTFETVVLPGLDVVVQSPAATPADRKRDTVGSVSASFVTLAAVFFLISLIAWRAWHTQPVRNGRQRLAAYLQQRRSYRRYLNAMRRQDSVRGLQMLYDQMVRQGRHTQLHKALRDSTGTRQQPEPWTDNTATGPSDTNTLEHHLRTLLAHAYGDGDDALGIEPAKRLWQAVSQTPAFKTRDASLHINPTASPG